MANKIHFNVNNSSACGRGTWLSQPGVTSMVTCRVCAKRPEFAAAKEVADAAKVAAFNAQEPREVREPWTEFHQTMTCSACGGTLFREADRSCYGHYSNHVCANCGHNESRLTETGMSF